MSTTRQPLTAAVRSWLDFDQKFLAVFAVYCALSFLFPRESSIPSDAPLSYLAANLLLLPGLFPIKPMITCSLVNGERLENMTVASGDCPQNHCLRRYCLLTFEKRQQVGIDRVGVGRWHAVRETLVGFQYRALHQLGA